MGDKRLPLLTQWIINTGLKYVREREEVGEFFTFFKGGSDILRHCLMPSSNLIYELIQKNKNKNKRICKFVNV